MKRILDVYVDLVMKHDDEVKLRGVANELGVSYEDFLVAVMFEPDFSRCTCEFADSDDPTTEELEACECEPLFHPRSDLRERVDGEDVFMKSSTLSRVLLEMPNCAGEELRDGAMQLVQFAVEEATGESVEKQNEHLAVALAHCTVDDCTPLERLLDETLLQVREHFSKEEP